MPQHNTKTINDNSKTIENNPQTAEWGGPPIGGVAWGLFSIVVELFFIVFVLFWKFSDRFPLFLWFLKVFLVFPGALRSGKIFKVGLE